MKLKTTKLKSPSILQSKIDWDFSECFNTFAGVCGEKEFEQLKGFLVQMYENKRCILQADGIL